MRRAYIVKLLMIGLVLALLIAGSGYGYFYYQEKPESSLQLSSFPAVQRQTRLLVIAPHCDDETLGCAGLIQAVLQAGGAVQVVVATNGDGFTFAVERQFHRLFLTANDYVESGYVRQKETVQALAYLGLQPEQITFLGYPDRGLNALWLDYWDSSRPYHSRYTDTEHTPYDNSYQQKVSYAGENVLSGLEQLMRSFKPTLIMAPHPADEHADHAAAWAFAATAFMHLQGSGELSSTARLDTYLVHRGDFPIPHGYRPEAALLPPRPLYENRETEWQEQALSAQAMTVKEQAVKAYTSQLQVPVMSSLLLSFIRSNELFGRSSIPEINSEPVLDATSLNTWLNKPSFLIASRGVNWLGVIEGKAKIATIGGLVQGNRLWLRFHIPDFSERQHTYQVALITFGRERQGVWRQRKAFSFSTAESDLAEGDILRFPNDVVVRLTYTDRQPLPDFFLLQVITRDSLGLMLDHTVWQPVRISL